MARPFRSRATVLVASCALLVGACGSNGSTEPDPPEAVPSPSQAGEAAATAAGGPAAPAPAPAAPPRSVSTEGGPATVAPQIELAHPDVLVRPEAEDPAAVDAAAGVDGVGHLAGASEFEARFLVPSPPAGSVDAETEAASPGPAGPVEVAVSVLGIDPVAFRPLTPEVTAQEPGVWQRLLEGDVVVRHDVAQKHGLELGDTYRLVGPAGEVEARVGAFASNGAPPLAEVLVPWSVGIQLGAGDLNLLVISVEDGADASSVADAVVDRLEGADVVLRTAPEEQRARLVATGQHEFEPFNYTDLGDGMIVIDPGWVARWITTVELPGLGTTRCHRVMIPQLIRALEEVQAAGLYGHFKREQFGGCYMPRHIDWEPSKPLSMHAWGLAIDLNTHDNWLGQPPQMDPRIVEIFERWGFEWGGRWARPDGMHFQLDRVIQVGN